MWNSVALMFLSLMPGQAELQLANPRWTYGILGPTRTEAVFLPGDVFFLTFDIENLHVDAEGKILYSMGMEWTNSKGKTQYKLDPIDYEVFNLLGGTTLSALVHKELNSETPPDDYTVKVTVIDRGGKTKKTKTLERKFKVKPKEFGVVRLFNSFDPEGQRFAPHIGMAGQSYWINFAAVGFKRDAAKKQGHIEVELRILDEKGKPTLAKPLTGQAAEVPEDVQLVPMQFFVSLTRAGKFTVELKAKDRVTNKSTDLSFPLTVLDAKDK